MPSPPSPAAPLDEDDPERDPDELGELPALDGDARDAPQPDAVDDDAIDDPDGEASLDDATGEGEPTDHEEIDLDESDSGWLAEPADAASIDLGDPGTLDFGTEIARDDDDGDDAGREAPEPAAGAEALGLGAAPERGGLDAGDEGPVDPDEELRAEDLPALDADDEGDADDGVRFDASLAADEPHGLAWASPVGGVGGAGGPWERVGAPLPLARAAAVCSAERGAVVVGRQEAGAGATELWSVDLEGASQPLAARGLELSSVSRLEGAGPAVRAWLGPHRAAVSTDGGLTFLPVDLPAAPEPSPAPPGAREPAVFATRAGHQACAADAGGVLRRAPGPAAPAWTRHAWGGRVTALAFLDDAGRLLAATYADADDTTALVHLDAAGVASVVARIGATRADPESDGQVLAMAYDEARGVVWVAGGFGLAAFAVR